MIFANKNPVSRSQILTLLHMRTMLLPAVKYKLFELSWVTVQFQLNIVLSLARPHVSLGCCSYLKAVPVSTECLPGTGRFAQAWGEGDGKGAAALLLDSCQPRGRTEWVTFC